MMLEGIRRLYSGDYNYINVVINTDGTRTVTLGRQKEGIVYKFRAKNLREENEEVLEYEEIKPKDLVPKYIKDRKKEAKEKK